MHISTTKAMGEGSYLRGNWISEGDRREIYERDGWICQICFIPVDPEIKWPDNMSPTLDHIKPWLEGGSHDPIIFAFATRYAM